MEQELVLDFSALQRLPTDKDLPYSDGEPMDTPWHRDCMYLLIDSLEHHWRDRKDFFVGGDMFLYFSPDRVFNKDFRGPDFFVVKGVEHDKKRLSYIAWQENSRLPCTIIELGSESTLKTDRGEKKKLYAEVLGTIEYFIYDPAEPRLEGWRLTNGSGYTPLEVEPGGRIWSKELELYIGPWEGSFLKTRDRWLRFFDVHGNLIPTGQEFVAAAHAAAVAEIERLRRENAALRAQFPPAPSDPPAGTP